MTVYNSFIHHGPKLETTEMSSTADQVNIKALPQDEILFSNTMQQADDISNTMDKSQMCSVQ